MPAEITVEHPKPVELDNTLPEAPPDPPGRRAAEKAKGDEKPDLAKAHDAEEKRIKAAHDDLEKEVKASHDAEEKRAKGDAKAKADDEDDDPEQKPKAKEGERPYSSDLRFGQGRK